MLLHVPEVLTGDELAQARRWLAESGWADGRITAGTQSAQVKRNRQLPEDAQHLPALRRLVLDALNRNPLFFAAALPLKILPPFFNRYGDDANFYGAHVDSAMRLRPDALAWWFSRLSRDIGAVVDATYFSNAVADEA